MADARTAFLITTDDAHEGGFQRDPNDRANWTSGVVGVGTLVGTKYGITTLDMPSADIENITRDQAIEYYIENYWKPLYSQISDQTLADKLADMGVLFGVATAVQILQRTLRIVEDGIFGPHTLDALSEALAAKSRVLAEYKALLHANAEDVANRNILERPNLADWQRRIDS